MSWLVKNMLLIQTLLVYYGHFSEFRYLRPGLGHEAKTMDQVNRIGFQISIIDAWNIAFAD